MNAILYFTLHKYELLKFDNYLIEHFKDIIRNILLLLSIDFFFYEFFFFFLFILLELGSLSILG